MDSDSFSTDNICMEITVKWIR